ncbi:retrovirus-related pol polyprotein from transposon TNT 1-94 [Tanacetum coccineum]
MNKQKLRPICSGNLGSLLLEMENPWSRITHEWSRFVTVVKQSKEIDTISYHKLFDILKQYQNEVNDIHFERLAKSANPLALVAAAQPYSDHYYQAPKSQRSNAQASKQSSSTRPSASTRHKGKEIAKPVTPQSEKPKRVKHYTYHKEKMMMCKQAEQGVPIFMAKIQEVLPEESSSTDQPLEQKDDSNVTPDSLNICNNNNQVDQNAAECTDERVALANLIANLTLDTEENKTIFKAIKESQRIIDSKTEGVPELTLMILVGLWGATGCRDSCLIAIQNKQNEFKKYKAFNDRTIDYDILQTKLNETLGLLARKDIDIKEGLKTKAYEISVVNQKHDELVKKSLLTKSQFEGQLKEKSKVILDLKVKEEKDIDKMIDMDKQIKFLNEILYKRNQSIQTIHMLAPKCATYNGRSTFANPKYLKIAQSEKPCLYEIPYDTSDHANRFCPNGEETVTLEKESRSKLNKDTVKPYDYTYQNSLYEIFKPPSKTYLDQLERAKEVRKTMWRKTFVRTKPNIAKNVAFLPVSKSISKNKTILDSHCFVHELKTEMHDDLEYVKSLEKEVDELESEKADFSNIYDLLLEECVSKDVICSYLHSLSDLNAHTGLQCLYLHKVKECECLAQKLSKQTESVNKEVHNNLLKSFSKLEKHSISLELALQQCKEQMKNNSVCKENGSNVFRKEREQYHEIQDLKAQMQDKNIAISELKKLIEKCKGKSVETQFDKPSVVRQPNAQRIPKPSVLGKPTPFSNSPEMRSFQTKQSVNKTNVSDGLFKQVTQQNLPQIRKQAVRNTNVIAPGPSRNPPTTTQNKEPQLPHASRNTNPHVSKSTGVNHTTSVSRPQLKGTEFLNKTLHAYFKEEGIEHQTSTPRTPEQNGVVERRNRTLVEAARTMLSASKLPLSFWAEAVATSSYTQNRIIIISTQERRRITSLLQETFI